jgi:hypothetical protein
MGLMDSIKGMFGKADDKADDSADGDSLKETAGSAKDKADNIVDQHGDKAPDAVTDTYDKASGAAEKIIPGDDAKDD